MTPTYIAFGILIGITIFYFLLAAGIFLNIIRGAGRQVEYARVKPLRPDRSEWER